MKTLIAILCLVSTVAWAQNPPPPQALRRPLPKVVSNQDDNASQNEPLTENYLVTLIGTDNDKVVLDLSMVVASQVFSVVTSESRISFFGNMAPNEEGEMFIRYKLDIQVAIAQGNGVSYQNNTASAGVKVRLGEPVQILKSGNQIYRLTVSRAPGESKKQK